MIGRLLRGGFMALVYAYLYIPIVILIVNSFNASRFGISCKEPPPSGTARCSTTTACCRPPAIR